jgi:hypothetical protein
MTPFDPRPRWPGAPPLCATANRLAFKDRQAMDDFRSSIGMSAYSSGEVWRCEFCGFLHYKGGAPSPSGDSSGTARSRKG